MVSVSCSNVHLRLVKKLPGQPPAGATVPSTAPAVLPSVITQAPPPVTASFHFPARSTGGGCGGGGAGGGGGAVATAWSGWPPPKRSVLVQAASIASTSRMAMAFAIFAA